MTKRKPSESAWSLRRAAEEHIRRQALPAPSNMVDAAEALHELHVHQIELEMQNEALAAARAEAEAALARFTHLYDFAPISYLTLQHDSVIRHANLAAARLFELPRAKLLRRHFASFVAEAHRPQFARFLDETFASRRQQTCEVALQPTPRRKELVVQIEAIFDDQAQECRIVVTDVTQAKRNEARLKLAASVFSHAQEGIMIMDADGSIIDVNHSFTRITGLAREAVLGQSTQILMGTGQDPAFHVKMWQDLAAKGQWYGEIIDRRGDSELYAALLKINSVCDASGEPRHYVALLSDITAIKEQQHRLERLAHYDALTGLPNRVLLADRLHHAMVQARRRENFMALVYLDLDGFKAVNDTHGHKVGDDLLVVVAQRLKDALREGDTLARLGGDEFVAVLADLSSTAECDTVLMRLLQAAAAPVHVRNIPLAVSASLGVTLSPQDPGDADVLLRHADLAMYQAKQAGKNRFHMFDPELDLHAKVQRESLRRIALALDRDEFVLHFQPKVNMRTGLVIGAEALIRWQHPERGLLRPGDFLLVAEDHETIARVGDWVLDAALGQMAAWQRNGLELPVSVNIAAHHLQQDDFLPRLREKLAAHPDVRPQNLELEVLETAALSDINHISTVIAACQALGVGFSLDDFGTGYSSLTYLKRLPATTLKIDQSFVRNMLWDSEDLAIVEGVIGLALAFSRQVIGEGVESADHGRLLLRLGCELAQGNGISPPLPAAAMPGWVARWHADPLWSGLSSTPLSRDTLSLIYAEVDHRQWVRQLEDLLLENNDTIPSVEANFCGFGRWYAQEGRVCFGHLVEFRSIGPLHERLHQLGSKLIKTHLAQDAGAGGTAQSLLDELAALRTLSSELLDHLQLLSAAINLSSAQSSVREAAHAAG